MEQEIKPSPTGNGITPQMPSEPPPEAKAMVFNYDSNLLGDSKAGDTIVKVDNQEVKEVKQPTITEVKPDEKIQRADKVSEDSSKIVSNTGNERQTKEVKSKEELKSVRPHSERILKTQEELNAILLEKLCTKKYDRNKGQNYSNSKE